ncbi:COMM domain-containing protein 4 isoform X2 [Phymastichus coffea]|nr:COMM domain-containing protein 4 isoform X2 [Phymastichus coffea]
MRFRFLGDVDCPDWLLAEIYSLSQMSASKIKSLGTLVVKSIIDGELDEEKFKKIAQDSKLEIDELQALTAAIRKIFISSSRNSVLAADLSDELQQLGLPREHSVIISRLHTDNCAQITAILTEKSLRLSRLVSAEVEPCNSSSPFAKLTIETSSVQDGEKLKTEINIPKDSLGGILTELKNIRSVMEQLKQ